MGLAENIGNDSPLLQLERFLVSQQTVKLGA